MEHQGTQEEEKKEHPWAGDRQHRKTGRAAEQTDLYAAELGEQHVYMVIREERLATGSGF